MHIEVIDKPEIGIKLVVAIRSVKHVMTNTDKSYYQVTVFTFKNIGFNKNGEMSVVLIKHGVESLPDEASLS